MKTEEAFGNVLKKVRKEKMISQEKLAQICELDRTYISLIERGLRNPTLVVLFSLSDALSVKPSELISATEIILKKG